MVTPPSHTFPNVEDELLVLNFPSRPPVGIRQGASETAYYFETGINAIDVDGAPQAYHEPVPGHPSGCPPALDHLGNASPNPKAPLPKPGQPWLGRWQITIDPRTHQPYKQGPGDPAQGFYVSETTLHNPVTSAGVTQRRYIDAVTVPYLALPPRVTQATRTRIGDFASLYNRATGRLVHAIYADVEHSTEIGEISVRLSNDLGVPVTFVPNKGARGGQAGGVTYVVYPRSGNARGRSLADISSNGQALFGAWGGKLRIVDQRVASLLDDVASLGGLPDIEASLASVQSLVREGRDSGLSPARAPGIRAIDELDDACAELAGVVKSVQRLNRAKLPAARQRAFLTELGQIRMALGCVP